MTRTRGTRIRNAGAFGSGIISVEEWESVHAVLGNRQDPVVQSRRSPRIKRAPLARLRDDGIKVVDQCDDVASSRQGLCDGPVSVAGTAGNQDIHLGKHRVGRGEQQQNSDELASRDLTITASPSRIKVRILTIHHSLASLVFSVYKYQNVSFIQASHR